MRKFVCIRLSHKKYEHTCKQCKDGHACNIRFMYGAVAHKRDYHNCYKDKLKKACDV